MEKTDKLLYDILHRLKQKGILNELILIGGWCQKIYRKKLGNPAEISSMRTADLDFIVKNRGKISNNLDIKEILSPLGFEESFSLPMGYIKYVHPDIEIEFLVQETGRAKSTPVYLAKLNTNAQSLRYLDILEKNTQNVDYFGLPLTIPQMAAFVLNKLVVSQRRRKKEKSEKDLKTAVEFGEYLLHDDNQKFLLRQLFSELNTKLQKKLLKTLSNRSSSLYQFLAE